MGGLTRARAIRDLAAQRGIPMNIEDTWGGDIVTAAIAALAHSTDPRYLFCRSDCWSFRYLSNDRTVAIFINTVARISMLCVVDK